MGFREWGTTDLIVLAAQTGHSDQCALARGAGGASSLSCAEEAFSLTVWKKRERRKMRPWQGDGCSLGSGHRGSESCRPPAASSWFSQSDRDWQCALACGGGERPFLCLCGRRETLRPCLFTSFMGAAFGLPHKSLATGAHLSARGV